MCLNIKTTSDLTDPSRSDQTQHLCQKIKTCQDPNCDKQDWTVTRIKEWNHRKRIRSGSKVRSHLNTPDWSWITSEPLKSRVELLFSFSAVFHWKHETSRRRRSSSPQYSEVIRLHCRAWIDFSLRWSELLEKKRSYQLFTRILSLLVKPLPPAGLKAALKLWLQSTSETKINHTFISFLTQRDIPSERDAIY